MTGIFLTILASIFILIGSLIVVINKNNDKIVDFSLALASIVIISLVFIELIPESLENIDNIWLTVLFIVLGIAMLKLIEHFIPHHDHKDHDNLYHIGLVAALALIIHNLIEGMSIYGVASSDLALGVLMSIGVGLHNIPVGMVVTSAIVNSHKKISLILIMLILSTFFGGLIMYLANPIVNDFILGIFLSLTSGMLFYILFDELLPKVLSNIKSKSTISGIIIGILVTITTLFL